jgi:hypothetical protein
MSLYNVIGMACPFKESRLNVQNNLRETRISFLQYPDIDSNYSAGQPVVFASIAP